MLKNIRHGDDDDDDGDYDDDDDDYIITTPLQYNIWADLRGSV